MSIKGNIMTSDRQIIKSHIKKIECNKCGLVRTGCQPNINKLRKEYQKNYEYNSSSQGDMMYFSQTGLQDRSSHTLNRILELLSSVDLKSIKTIVEIGCGEGNLIEKLQEKFPTKKIIGFEINEQAIKIGRRKGLDIRSLTKPSEIKADLLISYTVIEHTTSPKNFLKSITRMLNPNGLLILGTPHQDNLSYDIFFVDHLFHFSIKHLQDLARFSNLILLKKTLGSWPISSIVLCLFRLSNKHLKPIIRKRKTKVKQSFIYYNNIFKKINLFLSSVKKNKKLAIFGLGEVY